MSVRSPTAGTWSSSQWRPDNEFETDRRRLRLVPPGEGIHIVLDSTGLSIVGAGAWVAAKHGGRGRALTPLYVKTVVQAAKSAAWRARSSAITR